MPGHRVNPQINHQACPSHQSKRATGEGDPVAVLMLFLEIVSKSPPETPYPTGGGILEGRHSDMGSEIFVVELFVSLRKVTCQGTTKI